MVYILVSDPCYTNTHTHKQSIRHTQLTISANAHILFLSDSLGNPTCNNMFLYYDVFILFLHFKRYIFLQWMFFLKVKWSMGFPGGPSGKESTCQCRRCRIDPWFGKIPWRRKWQSTPVYLLGKSPGQRCLAGYSPWGRKKLDTTEHREDLRRPEYLNVM